MNLGWPFEMNLERSEMLHRVASAIGLLSVSLSCSTLSAQSIEASEQRASSLKGNYYQAVGSRTRGLSDGDRVVCARAQVITCDAWCEPLASRRVNRSREALNSWSFRVRTPKPEARGF